MDKPKFRVFVVGLDLPTQLMEKGLVPRLDLGQCRHEQASILAACESCGWHCTGGDWIRKALDHINSHERCTPLLKPGETAGSYTKAVSEGRFRRRHGWPRPEKTPKQEASA